jgi:hypothetical protein
MPMRSRSGRANQKPVRAASSPLTRVRGPCWGFWASNFPERQPTHYVFPYERYGTAGDKFTACAYDTDPSKPIGRWKEAWEAAKKRQASNAGSMTFGTPAALECWKLG